MFLKLWRVGSMVLRNEYNDELPIHSAGLPHKYRDSVRAITPGLPLFLYNYTCHQLHGVFQVSLDTTTNPSPM